MFINVNGINDHDNQKRINEATKIDRFGFVCLIDTRLKIINISNGNGKVGSE